jgi:hypothetical protein
MSETKFHTHTERQAKFQSNISLLFSGLKRKPSKETSKRRWQVELFNFCWFLARFTSHPEDGDDGSSEALGSLKYMALQVTRPYSSE